MKAVNTVLRFVTGAGCVLGGFLKESLEITLEDLLFLFSFCF